MRRSYLDEFTSEDFNVETCEMGELSESFGLRKGGGACFGNMEEYCEMEWSGM